MAEFAKTRLAPSTVSEKRGGASLSYMIMCTTVLVLFFFKSLYFYFCIKIGLFSPIFAVASVFFLLVAFGVAFCIRRGAGTAVLFTLYTLLSILMCVDVVYFSYLNKLPSVVVAKMMTLLVDVDTSVLNLVTLDRMILLLDLPIWFLWGTIFRRDTEMPFFPAIRRLADKCRRVHVRFQAVLIYFLVLLLLCTGIVGGALMREDFVIEYLGNEILTYHLLDVYNVVFYQEEERHVDPSKYLHAYAETDQESPYYGIAEGRNLIVIQVEAMQEFILNREYNGQVITPNLNAMIAKDTVNFDNYYYLIGGGNTCDAEFAVNNSLYAPDSEAAYIKYEQNDYYGLPWILKDNGYSGAYAFHAYIAEFWNRQAAYPKQGFDDYFSGEDMEQKDILGMGPSDYELFRQAVVRMETFEEPFYSFLVTLSSHYPFEMPAEYSWLILEEEHQDTLFGNYLISMHYVDWAIGQFMDMLKEAGLYENSVIVIYGDHFGLPNYDWYSKLYMTELLGHEYYENDVFKVPFIVHMPGSGVTETVSTTGGHIDATPTLLHLFGLQNRKSVMFGHNLFTTEYGILYEQTHMARGSFISDDVIYAMAQNGIELNNIAYDKKTGRKIPSAPYRAIAAQAKVTMEDCMKILDDNAVIVDQAE